MSSYSSTTYHYSNYNNDDSYLISFRLVAFVFFFIRLVLFAHFMRRAVNNAIMNGDGPDKIATLRCSFTYWFWLGSFGGHHFYLNRTCMGVLYFFTLGLFGIGNYVDVCFLHQYVDEYYISIGLPKGAIPPANMTAVAFAYSIGGAPPPAGYPSGGGYGVPTAVPVTGVPVAGGYPGGGYPVGPAVHMASYPPAGGYPAAVGYPPAGGYLPPAAPGQVYNEKF